MMSKKIGKIAAVLGSCMAMGCDGWGSGYTPAPAGQNTFVLTNNGSTTINTATLEKTGTVVSFWGTVTISGATSETVQYVETQGMASGACPVSGGTVIETIAFQFPKTFAFAPNGSSYGPNAGLMDTVFSTTATGQMHGAIYSVQNSACTVFSPSQPVYGNGGDSYEYPGGGNTSVPAGVYYLEIWD